MTLRGRGKWKIWLINKADIAMPDIELTSIKIKVLLQVDEDFFFPNLPFPFLKVK